MTASSDSACQHADGYYGRILSGPYSQALQQRVREHRDRLSTFEHTGLPIIHYLSAWRIGEEQIWYEFVSQLFLDLLGCTVASVAQIFRQRILEQRIYTYGDGAVMKEILNKAALEAARTALREASQQAGIVEAVYKVAMHNAHTMWLKDQAHIETYPHDKVCLSLGCLAIISKEIEREEQQEQRLARLQQSLDKVAVLRGILPICATCKKVRNGAGAWQQIEGYIRQHSDADFSHGICPECFDKALVELRKG